MVYACIALVLAWAGTVLGFLRYIHTRDEREDARTRSHREEVAQLNQARMEETADLLQRIQAPEQAVTSHVAESAQPDPPPVNLDSDEELFELAKQRMVNFGALNG